VAFAAKSIDFQRKFVRNALIRFPSMQRRCVGVDRAGSLEREAVFGGAASIAP
jgi:hypothetical protein